MSEKKVTTPQNEKPAGPSEAQLEAGRQEIMKVV